MKKFTLTLIALCFTAPLFGCNTIQGIGEDIKGIGSAISNGSEKVHDDIKNRD